MDLILPYYPKIKDKIKAITRRDDLYKLYQQLPDMSLKTKRSLINPLYHP